MRRVIAMLFILAACEGTGSLLAEDEAPDGSATLRDAGAADGGRDAEVDAGADDAGLLDAGRDAGLADAGEPDAGHDGGVADAGAPDAGHDAGAIDAGPSSARQVQRPLGSTDAGNGFYEYLPPAYGDGVLRPLLVFWHGIGENGDGTTQLSKVLANGPPKLIAQDQWASARPFVVLSPQHSGGGCPGSGEIRDFLSFAVAHYAVDLHRLYLTGLSCGAIGSWAYLGAHLDSQVAAAVLIAGDPGAPSSPGSVWSVNHCALGAVPIWSFHGSVDPTVNINDDRDTMTLLIACPAPPRHDATFTEYPNVGHDAWSRTYDLSAGHDVYSWLLGQSKP